jgi:WD40 repeat protein/Leucine-rich repeat (LRR) protein
MWRWSALACLFLVALRPLFARQPTVSRTLAVGSGPVNVAFSPDGKILASATGDGVKLWDIGTGKHTATLEDDRGIWSMAFSPDGKTLALASGPFGMGWNPEMKEGFDPTMEDALRKPAADEIRLWAVATAKSTAVIKSDAGTVWSVTFSPDGKTLASSHQDGTVKLWGVATGMNIATHAGHTSLWDPPCVPLAFPLAFSPDGKCLASGGGPVKNRAKGYGVTGEIKLWDVTRGRARLGRSSGKMQMPTSSAARDQQAEFNLHPERFLSRLKEERQTLSDQAERASLTPTRTLHGHAGLGCFTNIFAVPFSLSFSPDGKTLASGGSRTIELWDVATGTNITTFRSEQIVHAVAFSPDGKTVAAGSAPWASDEKGKTGRITLLDLATRKATATLNSHSWGVLSVAFSPDGSTLASGHAEGTVTLWELPAAAASGPPPSVTPAEAKAKREEALEHLRRAGGRFKVLAGGVPTLETPPPVRSMPLLPGPRPALPQGGVMAVAVLGIEVRESVWDPGPRPVVEVNFVLHVTDTDLAYLKWLPNLRTLTFGLGSKNVTDDSLKHLRKLTNLEQLSLFNTRVTGTGFEHLKGLPKLRELCFGGHREPITDASFQHLKGLTNLEKLVIVFGEVSGPALEHLEELPRLESLRFICSSLSDGSLKRLKGVASLRELGLYAVPEYGSTGSRPGFEDLQALSQLRRLEIGPFLRAGPRFSDSDLEHVKGLSDLESLHLFGNQVTASGLEHLKGLTKLRELTFTGITDAGMANLSGLSLLERLYLDGGVTDAGLIHLKGLAKLRELSLGHTKVTGPGLEHLEASTGLEMLDLTYARITDTGLAHLPPNLRTLLLRKTKVSDAGLEHVKKLTHLENLSLANTMVTGPGLDHLEALTSLHVLDLSSAPVAGTGLAHLPPNLRILLLRRTKVSDAGLEHLKGLTHLEDLYLGETTVAGPGLEHLKGLASLRKLSLWRTPVTKTDPVVKRLQESLPRLKIVW